MTCCRPTALYMPLPLHTQTSLLTSLQFEHLDATRSSLFPSFPLPSPFSYLGLNPKLQVHRTLSLTCIIRPFIFSLLILKQRLAKLLSLTLNLRFPLFQPPKWSAFQTLASRPCYPESLSLPKDYLIDEAPKLPISLVRFSSLPHNSSWSPHVQGQADLLS